MNCLPCFQNDEDEEGTDNQTTPTKTEAQPQTDAAKEAAASSSNAKAFTFRELAMATKNFRQECLLGEGGFGRVFKGKLQSTGQVVAVKQLDRNGMQGNNEFLVEVLMLGLLQHPNLVSLIGYCADGDQRLLVYEYFEMGNLEHHLFGDDHEKQPMDWYTRMKIAAGAAQGLEYLHEKANPPIIYRDLKPSNILLDDNYEPKLSDCGLAKLGGGGGNINPASRVMGTYGYSAPEYSSSGELTLKSDMYSFGVVLLELITGRRVMDTTRPNDEQNLVTWAQPIFRDPKRFPDLADPRLNKEFPVTSLNQAVGICAMCLQEEPSVRPLVEDVVAALSFLGVPQASTTHYSAQAGKDSSPSAFSPPPEQKMHYGDDANQDRVSHSDDNKSNQDRKSHSDDNKSSNEDSSSDESDNEGGNRESVSEQQNAEGGQSSVGEESGRLSERQNSDDSEEDGTYTGSDSGDESSNYGDAENTEFENSERPNPTDDVSLSSSPSNSSSKFDAGNLSSRHGSSRKSSPTKRTGSRRRKLVVTFKEPSKSSIRSKSKKEVNQEENSSQNQPVTPEDRQQSSSSENSSSSDSEDEQKTARHQKGQRREASASMDENEQRVFDDLQTDGPKLRHLQTR
ncbi:hypothetical protein RND81_04G217400 [Saponaria officinalis]|uniref:Protein kinase domain-containing protein n=1 Tax=Saponaria officinalis TaxID=3572 RepID=A0AAW1LGD7_SAPOF